MLGMRYIVPQVGWGVLKRSDSVMHGRARMLRGTLSTRALAVTACSPQAQRNPLYICIGDTGQECGRKKSGRGRPGMRRGDRPLARTAARGMADARILLVVAQWSRGFARAGSH